MKNRFKIFFVSSEVSPFAKTGGLADVSQALPKALKERGHEVRMMMPNYRSVNERKYTLRDVIRLKEMPVQVGGQILKANVKSSFLPDSKVQIYLLNYKAYFDRDGLYQNSAGNDYADNAERFIFFCRGCLETLKLLQWQPDVIHCNDWQTALIPVYLKTLYRDDPFFKGTSVLLSVHNIASQGIFQPSVLQKAGLPQEMFYPGSDLEFNGKLNFLKAGLMTADLITTVSQVYAQEIQHNVEYAMGLEGVLRARCHDLVGIVNGADYAEWSPEKDSFVPHQYSANKLSPKVLNKRELLNRAGFNFDERTPLVGMISRLDAEKGFDLLEQAFDDIMALGVQMFVLGAGDEKYHKMLSRFAKKYPAQLAVHLRFDNPMAHLIQAGADMFLMPSRYEPCGLSQLYALRYGTIPIVHATGSLAETVQNYDAKTETGTGFVFKRYEPEDMVKTIERAIKVFQDQKRWLKLMKNAMKQDFSWKTAAEKYTKLYARLVARSRK
ncbi:MAG: glycogen synthase GlgA [candidate division KSB1 bacterium]|nr:glycogen synthase GlgA [candidate division KSB1 bacterium]MDZ7303569.1 glycogen synthase GlgA [candidate division KSB1 bacterium]MDZ7312812.1 glycogen synthase GlgA [candidate division KSB1 bacterium]